MKLYLDGVLVDTIPFQDSVWYWDTVSSAIKKTVRLESIVLTDNFVWWADTFVVNQDYRNAYYVRGDWFLLYVTNSTSFPMDGAVVSSPLDYDSSSVLLASGDDADVGYYTASSMTDIRLYLFAGMLHVYASYDDQNTISTDGRAEILSLEPDDLDLLMKRRAGTRAKAVPQREPAPLRHLGEVLAGHSP